MEKQVLKLKEQKNAIILAHYYTPAEIQAVADYVGDSFYLAKIAKNSDASIIIFCGVAFMGESAKLLNPTKKVLMPDLSADCPMARMVKKGKIEQMRAKYDDLAVVCYINSTADLKCQSDVCVTSSNAVKIVKSLPNKNIFFIPDKNLGRYVAEQVPEKNIILNDGYCPVHVQLSEKELLEKKKTYPNALVLSHPECEEKILNLSDYIGSTAEIINFAKHSTKNEFIICTEDGVRFKLEEDNPDKKFYFTNTSPCCADMKLNTLEKLKKVLENEENAIELNDEIIKKSVIPLDKMLELAK